MSTHTQSGEEKSAWNWFLYDEDLHLIFKRVPYSLYAFHYSKLVKVCSVSSKAKMIHLILFLFDNPK